MAERATRQASRWIPMVLVLAGTLTGPGPFGQADDCPDGWITTKIGTKLTNKGIVHLRVTTEQCVVTITGCVKTDEQRTKAIEVAENTKYVNSVESDIKICPDDDDGTWTAREASTPA